MTKNEIAYAILPQSTFDQNCLMIELVEARKTNFIYDLTSPSEGLTVNKWLALAIQPLDKEVVEFLIKEELLYQKRTSGKTPHREAILLKFIHISPSQVQPALELYIDYSERCK